MKKRHFLTTWLSLSLLLLAAGASAETFELEFGYRWLSVDGNEDMYRTQINEEDGLLLRSFTLSTVDFNGKIGLLDHFRIDVSDLGSGPSSSLRIEAGKAELYNLRFAYRDTDMYSALPGHANPFLDQGIIPGQHTIDRNRKIVDIDLEFLPGRSITPFVGFSSYENEGPGMTTYFAGQDEFRLDSDLREKEKEFRLGAAFRYGNYYGQVTQGWRSVDVDESLSLSFDAHGGNNPGTILGRPISADALTRTSEASGDTPFTNLYVTGHLTEKLRLTADYVKLESDSDGTETEVLSGALVSFPLLRFFDGWDQNISARSESESQRGGLRAEYEIRDGVDLFAGFQNRSRDLEGTALINTLYLDTITFGDADPRDVETLLRTQGSYDRDEDILNVGIRARGLGPISFWAGYTETDQDVTVSPDLSEIVVPGFQSGSFSRTIKTVDAGISWAMEGFLVSVSLRDDEANNPILRMDYLDRERLRFRANWTAPDNSFRVGILAEESDQTNDRLDTGYIGEVTQFSADFDYSPAEALRLRGSWSEFNSDSQVRFRRPSTFDTDTSIHLERGESWEGAFVYSENTGSLEVGLASFENEGANPFEIDRFHARLSINIGESYAVAGEYFRDDYTEAGGGRGDYNADRVGFFLSWHP